ALGGGVKHAVEDRPAATLHDLVVEGQHQDAVHHGNAEQRYEADGGRDTEVEPGDDQRQHAASDRKGNPRQGEENVAHRAEQAIEQDHDQAEAHGDDHLEPLLGLLQGLEFAGPLDAIPPRQLHLPRNARLRIGDGALEVAAAHAEFDGDIPLIALVINVRGARIEGNGRDLVQRDVSVGAAAALRPDLDGPHPVQAAAVLRRHADEQRELPVAFQYLRCLGSAQGRLDDAVDVTRVEPVAGGLRTVHRDVQV